MARYRAKDLLLGPSILSVLRAPLGALFFWVVDTPVLALLVLFAGGLTDVVDGWYARHARKVTAIGALVDGAFDKLFVGSVIVALLLAGKVSAVALAALMVREIAEAPLVVFWSLSRRPLHGSQEEPKANAIGKLTTTFQFATLAAITVGLPIARPLLLLSFVLGTFAALGYWARALAPRDGGGGPLGAPDAMKKVPRRRSVSTYT